MTTLSITSRFAFRFDEPGQALLQFEAAALPDQRICAAEVSLPDAENTSRVPAHGEIGTRIWAQARGAYQVDYNAEVAIEREDVDLSALAQVAAHAIPAGATEYLFDSRYCPVGSFQHFVDTEFSGFSGGARIAAIRDWIAANFTYEPGVSGPQTTAADSFLDRRGICRDYAHVLVAMARASLIPARYVACYGPGVTPQDFHAVAQVFLADPSGEASGAWYLVDGTGMARASETAIIGVGRDAADVAFLTNFSAATFLSSAVSVECV